MKNPKIQFKLVRSFSMGFTIYSPKLNGLCFDFDLACFSVCFLSRGNGLIGCYNYWHG